jgi:ATP synthase protein I
MAVPRVVPSKPLRTVIRWQVLVTIAMSALGGYLAGVHGAISAALGGLIAVAAAVVYLVMLSMHRDASAGGVLLAALRAEAAKVLLIIVLLWLVLATYRDANVVGFIGAFAVSVIIFAMAVFVRDE